MCMEYHEINGRNTERNLPSATLIPIHLYFIQYPIILKVSLVFCLQDFNDCSLRSPPQKTPLLCFKVACDDAMLGFDYFKFKTCFCSPSSGLEMALILRDSPCSDLPTCEAFFLTCMMMNIWIQTWTNHIIYIYIVLSWLQWTTSKKNNSLSKMMQTIPQLVDESASISSKVHSSMCPR